MYLFQKIKNRLELYSSLLTCESRGSGCNDPRGILCANVIEVHNVMLYTVAFLKGKS